MRALALILLAAPATAEGLSETCTATLACGITGCQTVRAEFGLETTFGDDGIPDAYAVFWQDDKIDAASDGYVLTWLSTDGEESLALSYIFNDALQAVDYAEFALMRTRVQGRMGDVVVEYGLCRDQ